MTNYRPFNVIGKSQCSAISIGLVPVQDAVAMAGGAQSPIPDTLSRDEGTIRTDSDGAPVMPGDYPAYQKGTSDQLKKRD